MTSLTVFILQMIYMVLVSCSWHVVVNFCDVDAQFVLCFSHRIMEQEVSWSKIKLLKFYLLYVEGRFAKNVFREFIWLIFSFKV